MGDFMSLDPFDLNPHPDFKVPDLLPKVPHRPGEVPSDQVYDAQNRLLKALRAFDHDPQDPHIRGDLEGAYKLLNSWLKVHGN